MSLTPSKLVEELPVYLQDISEDIYRSSLPPWMKTTMTTHLIRYFSTFCVSVGENKVEPDRLFFFNALLLSRREESLGFEPTDRMATCVFLHHLQKALLGSESYQTESLLHVLHSYGHIVLKGSNAYKYVLQ